MSMSKKIVGILGGLGPEATLDLFRRILELTPAKVDQDHIHVIIDSNTSIPDPNDSLMLPGAPDSTEALRATARGLEKIGADFIAIPCNTAHCFLQPVRESVHIPVLSIIDETVKVICELSPSVKKVGLLAGPAVITRGLYSKPLLEHGIETLTPDEAGLETVHHVIFAIKAKDKGEENWVRFQSLAGDLIKRGAEALILACTELPLLFDAPSIDGSMRKMDVPCVDTLDVLARAVVREAGVSAKA
jgi:aspartate racemase